MRPVTVSTTIARPVDEVFDYLDQLPHHEQFCDHFLVDWSFSGPTAGVGARVRARARRSRADWIEVEVVEVRRPTLSVEQGSGAGGRRRTRGTYRLEPLGPAQTRVTFTLETLAAPVSERMAAPLVRAYLERANQRALDRLRALLEPGAQER